MALITPISMDLLVLFSPPGDERPKCSFFLCLSADHDHFNLDHLHKHISPTSFFEYKSHYTAQLRCNNPLSTAKYREILAAVVSGSLPI